MKKIFFSLSIIIILILGSIFGILFTSSGNKIISSYIENKVNNNQQDVKLKVNNFKLTFKTINFDAVINDDSYINIAGDLAIFKKSVDLKYDIKINDLATLKNLTNQDFKGKFYTYGIFKGDKQESIIQGFSDIANSQTKYNINLIDFKINNVFLELKDAKIDELLALVSKPIYAKGNLTVNANIKNIDENNLDGLLTANISKGSIKNSVINKEFNQTIASSINFEGDINASLLGNKIDVKTTILSSIADIFAEKTEIDLVKNSLNSDYKIDFKNLNKLEGFIDKKLSGEFSTVGDLEIKNSIVLVNGKTNIFEGISKYNFEVKNSNIHNLTLKMEKLKLDKLLHTLNEPVYMTGDLNVEANIKDGSSNNLNGKIISKISNAKIINEVVNAVYKQELKKLITFDSNIHTSLIPNQAISNIDLNTNIATLNMDKTIYYFDKKILNSDYILHIPSLEKLKDLTKMNLLGKMDIKGKLKKEENDLFLDGISKIVGGVLDFSLKNDNLKASLNDANIKDVSYLINKPQVFDSKSNLKLDYNLLTKKGNLTGELLDGHFLPNDFSTLINQLSKFDLTREIYDSVKVNSKIDDKKLISTLNMKSKNTQIDINDSLLDFDKNQINAKLDTKIRKNDFSIILTGEMDKPNVSLDAKDLLKNEIDKKLEKNKEKIEEKINKVLGGKIDDEKTKELIENIKSIF